MSRHLRRRKRSRTQRRTCSMRVARCWRAWSRNRCACRRGAGRCRVPHARTRRRSRLYTMAPGAGCRSIRNGFMPFKIPRASAMEARGPFSARPRSASTCPRRIAVANPRTSRQFRVYASAGIDISLPSLNSAAATARARVGRLLVLLPAGIPASGRCALPHWRSGIPADAQHIRLPAALLVLRRSPV